MVQQDARWAIGNLVRQRGVLLAIDAVLDTIGVPVESIFVERRARIERHVRCGVIDAGSNVMQREMSLSRVTRQKLHVDLIERLAEVGEPTDYRTRDAAHLDRGAIRPIKEVIPP